MTDLTKPFTVKVHYYESPTQYSTAYQVGPDDAPNAIIAIGGLGDGPHTVPSQRRVASMTDGSGGGGPAYSVFEIRMRSSFRGWGTTTLADDVAHISCLVKYLRGIGKKMIVLMGHSTGCQDIMEYVDDKHKAEPVDGYVLQGPVSDRESLNYQAETDASSGVAALIESARKMQAEGRMQDCIPTDKVPESFNGTPLSAYRVLSLANKGGDDDFFSEDLDPDFVSKVWGRFIKPVLVLHSEKDEFVVPHVDKQAMIDRWAAASTQVSPLSGLIPGASHAVSSAEAQDWFAKRVAEFVTSLGESSA